MNTDNSGSHDNLTPLEHFLASVARVTGGGLCVLGPLGAVIASAGSNAPTPGTQYKPAPGDLALDLEQRDSVAGRFVVVNPSPGTTIDQIRPYAVAAAHLIDLPSGSQESMGTQDENEKPHSTLFQQVVDNYPGIIGIMGPPPDFRLLFANREYLGLLTEPYNGGTETAFGKTIRQLSREWNDRSEETLGMLAHVYETGEAVSFEQYEAETPGKGKSYWNWTVVRVRESGGDLTTPGFIMLIATDTTDTVLARKHIQGAFALARSRAEELDAVITQMAEGVAIFDERGEIKRMNPAAEHLLGRGVVQGALPARQAEIYNLFTPDGEPYSVEDLPITSALAGETVVGEQIVVHKSDEDDIFIRASVAPITDSEGNITGAVGVFHDVTQETLIDRLKNEFVSIVSHELRTPLTAIMGYSDLMLRGVHGALSDRQAKALNAIRANANRLLHLINDLLDVSKLESGKVQIDPEPVDLGSVISRTLAQTRVIAAEAGIALQNYVPQRSIPRVLADEAKLQQIIENLLTNAIKFTPAGGTITFEARTSSLPAEDSEVAANDEDPAIAAGSPAHSVVISVSDTGSGLESEQLGRIWDRFYQVDGTSKRRSGGAGLGLAIVRSLVELHGGQVWAESRGTGHGSTFRFSLPLADPGALPHSFDEPPRRVARHFQPPKEGTKGTVLVAEDDADQREIICEMLELDGFDVVLANDGEEALDLVYQVRPSAIILDVILPLADGWEVLHLLKKDPRTSDIPVLVISVVDQPGFGRRLGADEYLLKPLEPSSLRRTVHRLVGVPGGLAENEPADNSSYSPPN